MRKHQEITKSKAEVGANWWRKCPQNEINEQGIPLSPGNSKSALPPSTHAAINLLKQYFQPTVGLNWYSQHNGKAGTCFNVSGAPPHTPAEAAGAFCSSSPTPIHPKELLSENRVPQSIQVTPWALTSSYLSKSPGWRFKLILPEHSIRPGISWISQIHVFFLRANMLFLPYYEQNPNNNSYMYMAIFNSITYSTKVSKNDVSYF